MLFVVNTFLRKLLQTKYLQPLFLTMEALLDAILDFPARTNFRQCIPLTSQTTDYKVHFGIYHVLLYFYEHPTFILALKVTLPYILAKSSNGRPTFYRCFSNSQAILLFNSHSQPDKCASMGRNRAQGK